MSPKKPKEWNRLDNAAKIFPHAAGNRDTKVFRFSCQLTEDVDEAVLQKALDSTLEDYPIFSSVLKHGLFWYYLERSSIRALVQEENLPPCAPLYDKNVKTLLFRVTYFKERINLEVFHALSDGTGTLQFLRSLVSHYLAYKYPQSFPQGVPVLDYDASSTQKNEDSFQKYYQPGNKVKKVKSKRAYQISGGFLPEGRMKVIEGIMPVQQLLELSHKYNATITVFLASVFIHSIAEEMPLRHKNKPVVLSVPVNLRRYFNSETARNFFGVVLAGYDFSKESGTLEDIIKAVVNCFDKQLTTESLSQRITRMAAIEHNYAARAVPLAIKDIILRQAASHVRRAETSSFSNVGKIIMPPSTDCFIKGFDVFVSTDRIQACLCSYKENLTISFTSAFVSTDIQKRFFRTLSENGVDIKIISNIVDNE